jgi:DNA-binding SARP family transcriptional activator
VPTASKERQVLAILAANAGELVSTSRIIDELWGQSLPRSVSNIVQTYIFHLRKKLDKVLAGESVSPREFLVTELTGYRLNIDADVVDVHRYERLSLAGRRAVDMGDFAAASATLRAALDVWRGPAFADVSTGPRLQIEATRLTENRLTDLDLCIDADLRIGRCRQLLGDLAVLCAEHPTDESFHAKYMLALYRAGRQSSALDAYRRLCANMVDQLGIDPSDRLRDFHRAILNNDLVTAEEKVFSRQQRGASAFAKPMAELAHPRI